MFDLEKSIAKWRKQMLAVGIKTPVPLEELEIHLREEIERQMQSGLSEQKAFEIAVRTIGQEDSLKTEFAKTGGLLNWFGDNKTTNYMKKIGIGAIIMALLMAAVLHLAGAPLASQIRVTHSSGTAIMIDSSWQIRWYAFALAGLLVAGVVLIILPRQEKGKA